MQVTCTVSLNGLEGKLNELGPKLARSHLRKALKAAAEIWVVDAKSRVPVDTGDLRDSIRSLVVTSASQEMGKASVGPCMSPELKKSGGDTSQDPGVYGRFVELGLDSRKMKRTPFLRPAYDSKGDAVVAKFVEVLAEGLEAVTN